MSEWKTSKLKDITIFIKDGTHGTHKDVPDGIPLLSAKDIENGKILIPDNCRTVSENDYKLLHANYEIENDDLLLTVVGTIGRVAIAKKLSKKITFQRSVSIIRIDKSKILPDYSFHYFQSFKFQQTLERSKNASAQGGVYLGELAKARIFHPVLPSEQQKIAHILTTCDTVIGQTQSAIAKYKAIKQGLLHDLFTCGLDANGHLRPSYPDAPELYKESELGMIPKEWEVKRFGDFVHLIHGFQFRDYDFTENGIPIVKIGQIKPENVDLSNCSFISKDRIDEFRSITIRNGDVLMALTGATLGKACQVKKLKNDVLQNYRVGRFEPKNLDEIHKGFLYYTLTSRQFLNQVFSKVNAGAQGNIGKSDFEKPLFKMPDFNEQLRIFDRLESLNHKLESEETLLQKYQSIKRGLMGDLLGGGKMVGDDG